MTLTTALWLLLGLWILSHICFFGILFRESRYFAVVLSTILLIIVYGIKPATFDLPRYSVYFETRIPPWLTSTPFKKEGWRLEDLAEDERGEHGNKFFPHSPAFTFSLDLARTVLPHGSYLPRIITERHVSDSLVLLVGTVCIALLVISLSLLRGKSEDAEYGLYTASLIFAAVLGSVFFFVGSQNALRQFIGSTLAMLAFGAYVRSKFVLAPFSALVSFLFHPWSPLIVVFGAIFFETRRLFRRIFANKQVGNFLNEYLIALMFGIAGIVAIKIGISLGSPYFTTYFLIDTSGETYRTSAPIKLVLLGIVLVVTDLIAGKAKSDWWINPVSMRRCFLILLAPLVIYPEIFSRLLMFYFAVEMIYLIWAVSHAEKRVQLSGCVIFFCYALALNALNILLDKDWREILFYA